MNIVDVIIVLTILSGAAIGFRRGVITQTVAFVGFIAIFLISYWGKGFIAFYLCKWLPFFDINLYSIKSIAVLNILFYELIAFLIIFGILSVLFKIVLTYTEVFEAILKNTVVLALPLKILGAIVGLIEYYLIVLIIIVILSSPMLNIDIVKDSKLANKMLSSTSLPFLPLGDIVTTFDDLAKVGKINYKDHNKSELQILDIMLDNNMTDVKLVDELVKTKKLKLKNIDTILDKYRK